MEWTVNNTNRVIRLLTVEEFKALPNGTVLVDIFGDSYTKGKDDIDLDTRGGYIAFGFEKKAGE